MQYVEANTAYDCVFHRCVVTDDALCTPPTAHRLTEVMFHLHPFSSSRPSNVRPPKPGIRRPQAAHRSRLSSVIFAPAFVLILVGRKWIEMEARGPRGTMARRHDRPLLQSISPVVTINFATERLRGEIARGCSGEIRGGVGYHRLFIVRGYG